MFKLLLTLFLFHFATFIFAAPVSNHTSKWSKPMLTYEILRYPTYLTRDETWSAFRYAFDQVSALIPVKFHEASLLSTESTDIRILFSNNSLALQDPSRGVIAMADKQWTFYRPEARLAINRTDDIHYAAMFELRKVLQQNKVPRAEFIQFQVPQNSAEPPKFIWATPVTDDRNRSDKFNIFGW